MTRFRRWQNPFTGAPVMPDANQLADAMYQRYEELGWAIQDHPNSDDIAAFIEYVQAAMQSLPAELQPYLNCEWSFGPWTPVLIHLPKDWDRGNVNVHDHQPSNRYGIEADFFDDGLYEHGTQDETDFQNDRSTDRVQEPAWLSNDDVHNYGIEYIDDLMSGGKWIYPVDENDEFINYLETRKSFSGRTWSTYDGSWQYVGMWHPSHQSEEDFARWIPVFWRKSLGLPIRSVRHRRRSKRKIRSTVGIVLCRHCGAIVTEEPDEPGVWIDQTGGDGCHSNQSDIHEPELI